LTVELLAPCGSPEALDAALAYGADAVYFGGTILNARINAKNFTDENIKTAIEKCHGKGVKVYVTLNTLVYDKEFETALSYAARLYEMGADALIVTDLGFAAELKKQIPDLELHASTQTSGHNSAAAQKLSELGFSRMVCARELNYNDIKKLVKDSPIGIEMFIHGAHCASVSGQCLMSSVIGGRSGNRGECAQPCRMKYNGGYPLSLKDMCLAGHITEILESGVKALKIEGRMRSPDYVKTAVAIYRRLIDERRNAIASEIEILAGAFSRSGFTDGYFTGKINNSMLGIRTESDKENSRRQVKLPVVDRKLPYISIIERNATIKPIQYDKIPSRSGISARFLKAEQIPEKHKFDVVYLPLSEYTPKANGVILPAVITDSDKINIEGAQHVLIGNIGHLRFAEKFGLIPHGDYRLNVTNNAAMQLYCSYGLQDIILSPELNLAQIRDITSSKSVIVYGRLPLMTLKRRTGYTNLKDRTNATFPIFTENGYEILYNSVPIYMADKNVFQNQHFIFTTEKNIAQIIEAYEKRLPPTENFRRIK